jgi:SAM-dependent methyltransferase
MPGLDTDLHIRMLAGGRASRSLRGRVSTAARALMQGGDSVYGLEWGDPETLPPLVYVRDHYLLPYIDPSKTVLEIGPGGGRWTRYMMGAGTLYAVDYHQELLNELHRHVRGSNLHPILNNGNDFPGIPDASIDFGFSFGTFVHLDVDIIERYLANLKRVLAPGATVVIQYSDKTKPLGKENKEFSENSPEAMRAFVTAAGYEVQEEDTGSLWHSAIIRFRLAQEAGS